MKILLLILLTCSSVLSATPNSFPEHLRKSTERILTFNALSVPAGGDIFLGGRKTFFETENGKDKIVKDGVLVRISNGIMVTKRLPFVGEIDNIFFLDNNTGWVLCQRGIYKTEDGGGSWKKIEGTGEKKLSYVMSFFNRSDGRFFQNANDILSAIKDDKSSGDLFVDKSCEKGICTLHKMQFANEQVGWITKVRYDDEKMVATHEFIRTRDGGKSWKTLDFSDTKLFDFQFVNDNQGYVLTSEGAFATNDQGDKWRLVKENDVHEEPFNNLFFLNKDTGWIVGDKSCFTESAGANWECSVLPDEIETQSIKSVAFSDRNNGAILLDDDNGFFVTKDGGNTWKRYFIKMGDVIF
jgi:photosystem II stability/assembly factor-like uncharacterized protein